MSEFTNNEQSAPNQTIIINQPSAKKSNGLGTAGFVLALNGLVLCWVPVVGWVVWAEGFIFSLIGVFKAPRGLAIAGLIISGIGLIAISIITAMFASALDDVLKFM